MEWVKVQDAGSTRSGSGGQTPGDGPLQGRNNERAKMPEPETQGAVLQLRQQTAEGATSESID
eukprot:1136623-Pelagomonas_calceolata.AAC.2